jgi:tRNA modification GTPase
MLPRHQDPIAAIATAPGRGGGGHRACVGQGVGIAGRGAVRPCAARAREATYLPFRDAVGQPIDQGLALYFPAPHSYTGEDVLELQAHGGPVVLQLLLARCLEAAAEIDPASGQPRLAGLRLARPGEFTERAFLNDKIDLAQAEAIADLIDASTEAAARSASRSLSGAFSQEIHALRDALIHLRMLVEATLDFPEEEIDFLRKADARGQLSNLEQTMAQVLQRTRQGALLREGIKVVIAGQPNAGKSSLLNALAGAELAIVTPIAGTTRDKVQQTIQIEGVPLHVIDTAGLRDSADEVERIGIARAWDAIAQADAVLFLHDLVRCADPGYQEADAVIAQTMVQRLPPSVPVVDVWNKSDCAGAASVSLNQADAGCASVCAHRRGAGASAPAPAGNCRLAGGARGGMHCPRSPCAGIATGAAPPGGSGCAARCQRACAGSARRRAATGAERSERHHGRIQFRRFVGRHFFQLLHRQVTSYPRLSGTIR